MSENDRTSTTPPRLGGPDPAADLLERIRGFVRLADLYEAAEFRRALDKARRELDPKDEGGADLNERDAGILAELALAGPLGFSELVGRLSARTSDQVRKSTISQAIGRLADDKGLVERSYERGPRQPVLRLTELGARIGGEIAQVLSAVPANVGECFGGDPEAIRELHARFGRFSELLSRKSDDVRPNVARIYDYMLGGWHHNVADREAARRIIEVIPDARGASIENRAFLRRAVRYLAEERGVRRFLDIGAGLPTTGNTHQIAQDIDPSSRVVYVDRDREVVEQAKLATEGNANVRCIEGDFLQINALSEAGAFDDFFEQGEPVAVVCVAMLHDVPDDEMAELAMRRLRERFVGESGFLVISHGSDEGTDPAEAERSKQRYEQIVRMQTKGRGPEKIRELLLGDLPVVEPGIVWAPEWRPEIADPYLQAGGLPFADEPARSMVRVCVAGGS